jgi:hypothetical protein
MNETDKDIEKINDDNMTKPTIKDILAFMIAQFEILMPIVLIFVGGMTLILFLISKFGLK